MFDRENRLWTLLFFVAFIVLCASGIAIGITDNPPGIFMLEGGMVMLIYAHVHIWKNWHNYLRLAGISAGIIAVTFAVISIMASMGLAKYLSEAIVMGLIGLFCIPGIIAGIIGVVVTGNKKQNQQKQ